MFIFDIKGWLDIERNALHPFSFDDIIRIIPVVKVPNYAYPIPMNMRDLKGYTLEHYFQSLSKTSLSSHKSSAKVSPSFSFPTFKKGSFPFSSFREALLSASTQLLSVGEQTSAIIIMNRLLDIEFFFCFYLDYYLFILVVTRKELIAEKLV
jgi:hypothetical protein